MMPRIRIFAQRTFLDGRDRYEEGQVYDVAQDKAQYFIRQGWASYAGKTPALKRLFRRK